MSEQRATEAPDGRGERQGGEQPESSSEVKRDAGAAPSEHGDAPGAQGAAGVTGAQGSRTRLADAPFGIEQTAGDDTREGDNQSDARGGLVASAAALGVNFATYFNAQLRKATNPVKLAHKSRQWIVTQIDEGGVKLTEPNGAAVEYVEPTVEVIAYLVSQVAHL